MKTKKTVRNIVLGFIAAFSIMIVYSACEQYVALGAGIDILPPKGTITYPPVAENPIRGSFVIKGTAKDDEGIVSITAVFENNDTKQRTRSFAAKQFNQTAETVYWEIDVDNQSTAPDPEHPLVALHPIPDGEYTLLVTLTDKNGKTTTLNHTCKIDNTPPVFIVERPSLSADYNELTSQGDGYGAVMKIKGSAADTHELRSVTLKVNDGLSITKKNKENSVDLVMASFPDDDYTRLKDAAGGEDKPLKAVITLQDNARTYGGGTPGNTGNESAFYYIKSELEADLDLNKYTAKVISDYFSGKEGKNGGTPHEQAVYDLRHDQNARNVLRDKRIIPAEKKSVFTLNPNKSPGFKVVGAHTVSFVEGSVTPVRDPAALHFSTSTSLTVELYPNMDRNAIVSGTDYAASQLQIFLHKGNAPGELKDLPDSATYNPENYPGKSFVFFDATASSADFSGVSQSGGLIKITKPVPADIGPGFYKVIVKGQDVKKNKDFTPYNDKNKPSGGFLILEFKAAGAPYLFPHQPNRYQKEDFDIFCTVENGAGASVYYSLTGPAGENAPAAGSPSILNLQTSGPDKGKYKGRVKTGSIREGRNTLYLRARVSEVLFATGQVEFIFDKTPPSDPALDPGLPANDTFSAWSHIFKGTAADSTAHVSSASIDEVSDIDKVTYQIGKKTAGSPAPTYEEEVPAKLTKPADGSNTYKWEAIVSFGQKTDNYVRINVYDKAGNKKNKDFGPYKVNTDGPQINFEDVRFSLGTPYSAASPLTLVKQNAVIGNGLNGNKKASFKIFAKSAFGIKSVKVSVGGGEKSGMPSGEPQLNSDGYEEWTVNDVPLVEGNPNFKLDVTAKSGTVTEWRIPVIVDFTRPKVTQTSPNLDNIFFTQITLSGSITDTVPEPNTGIASGPNDTTVQYKIGGSGFVKEHTVGGTEYSKLTYSGGAWTVNIPDIRKYKEFTGVTPASGTVGFYSIPVQIQVNDKAGNSCTSKEFIIKFDPEGGAPFAELTSPAQGAALGGDILISGSAGVANPASGKTVTEIYLQMGETEAGLKADTTWMLNGINYGAAAGVKIYPLSGTESVLNWRHTLPDLVRTAILNGAASKDVFLRVRAKNSDNVFSSWTEAVHFTINTDAAKFSVIELQNGTQPVTVYSPTSVWLKGDTFKILGSVFHSKGIKDTIKAASPDQLPEGYEKLDTTGSTGWFTGAAFPDASGYTFTIPIKTSHYTRKAGFIQFNISAIDARSDGTPVPVSYPITLKYDNSKPAVTAGVHKVTSDTALFTGGQFAANLDNTKKALYRVLVNNEVYKVDSIDGTNVRLSGASSLTGSFDYGIVEQPVMIYDPGSDYQITGIAYDTGSGVQKIIAELSIPYQEGGQTGYSRTSIEMTRTNTMIKPERGDMVSFKGTLNTQLVKNGKGTLKITAYDGAENEISETITNVIVKNSPVLINEIKLQTDLSGNNAYESGENITISAFGAQDANRDFRGEKDVKSDFTFKNPTKSEIAISLAGGKGTKRTVKLYKDSVSAANLVMEKTETLSVPVPSVNVITLNLANETNPGQTAGSPLVKIGDAADKKLIIHVFDDERGDGADWYAEAQITVGVDAVDDSVPKGFIMPFFYNSDESRITKIDDLPLVSTVYDVEKTPEGVITRVKDPLGHIEISGISSLGADIPCVSGKVKLRGIAYDNIRLKKLELSGAGISGVNAEFSGGNWTSTTGLTVKSSNLSNTGHYVEWEYEWNTGAPALNQTVTLTVKDAADPDLTSGAGETDGNAGTGTRNGDRGMTLGGTHKAVKHQFIRLYEDEKSYLVQVDTVSADGKTVTWNDTSVPTGITTYRLYDETSNKTTFGVNVVPYVSGIVTKLDTAYSSNPSVFNRSATGAYPVRNDEIITVKGFNLKSSSGNPAVSIGTIQGTPTENEIKVQFSSTDKSGDFDVTVGTIKSINNSNSDKVYNSEPNNANNDILTDDRKLHVWKFNTVKTDSGVRYPTMRVGKDSGQTVGFVYGSGAQSVRMNLNNQDFRIDYSYTQWYDTACAVDNTGKIYGAAMNSDSGASGTQSNGGYANFGFYAWNTSDYPGKISNQNPNTEASSTMAYSSGHKKVALENAYNGSIFNSNRIVSPKIVTNGAGKVYTAYYDASAKQVKFRYGTISGNPDNDMQLTFDGGLRNHDNAAGGSAAGAVEIASGATAGPYVAVGVVPAGADAGRAVVAWYDPQNQRLMYRHSTSATDYTSWSAAKEIDKDFVGWYVDLVADKDGGIHIAYYSAQNGDLKYAYLSKYDAVPVVCSVDSFLSVGTNISIEVSDTKKDFKKYTVNADTGEISEVGTEQKYVPYISYYMSSFTRTSNSVRVAYLAETKPIVKKNTQGKYELAADIADGVKNDKYTGIWEVMTIPTKQIPLDYTVGVGIKKNTANEDSVILGYGTTDGLETAILE